MSRDTTDNLKDVFAQTARRKAEAAAYRNAGKPEGAEDSRAVYLSACSAIASNFESLGFRYAKSGPHFSRLEEPFAYRVSFQSSHNNIPGRHVRLWMHATVQSKMLQAWRRSRLPPNFVNDFVAGGMVHRLRMKHAMVEWELADPATRPSVIADAVAFLQSDVLPYFAQFRDPKALIRDLSQREIPAFDLRPSVEFAICFGDIESGQRVLERFLTDRPDLSSAIAQVEEHGLKHPALGPSNFAEQVVFLRRTYQLE
jgi:hypothetical protein